MTNKTNCNTLEFGTLPKMVERADFKQFSLGEKPDVKDPLVAVAGVLVKDLAKRAEEEKKNAAN